MVRLTKIYTKAGDQGLTSNALGTRISKDHILFECIGQTDDINSHIGLTIIECKDTIQNILSHIQHDLFDFGADLACYDINTTLEQNLSKPKLRIQKGYIRWLEYKIDEFNKDLQPLSSFVLPGGDKISALFHCLRTKVRQAERSLVALNKVIEINPYLLSYMNRLSDLFFVLARFHNDKGQKDVLWIPGKNIKNC